MPILNYTYFVFKIVNRRKAVDLKHEKVSRFDPKKTNLHNTGLEPPHFPAISPRHSTGEEIKHHFKPLKPLIICIFVGDRFCFRLYVKSNNKRVLNVNLRDKLICIMRCEIRTNNRKFEVAVRKEDKKRKVFLHFYAS